MSKHEMDGYINEGQI